MSEPSSSRSAAEEHDESQQLDDDDGGHEQHSGDEHDDSAAGAEAAAASASVSPRGGDAASPAEQSADASARASSRHGDGSVQIEDEKPGEEESKEEEDSARALHSQRGHDDGDGDGSGGQQRETADSGDGDAAEQDDLRAAAAEELEELEPEAEQGSQTNQQQQQQQQQHQHQQYNDHDQQQNGYSHPDDEQHPDGVGADSYSARGPERQVYDDDGGAGPDDADTADPSAADYAQADRGQFAPEGGAGSAPAYVMPDVLKVVINREELEAEADEEEERELSAHSRGQAPTEPFQRSPEQVVYVQVIKDNLHHPKAFLGGFRHKYYGTVYHHASSQTARKKKKAERVRFHRETQTMQIISRAQQTNREIATQMERADLLQDHSNDSVIMSRPYFTADELEALRDSKAREIQCFLRQCFAWRRVRRLREAKADQVESEAAAAAAKAAREASEHALQIQRRMHPRTRADFAVLYSELEAWRLHETQRIKDSAGLSPEEIAVALSELLHKEVKLLQTIDRLKITAARENKWARTAANLEAMASPKEWCSREGDLIEVDTPFTTRAKELVDLYNGLVLRGLSRAQRVDVLLHVKYTVKEFDCALSRDIVDLIKREEDLLRRQRSEASLEGLRRRLQNLFLHFVNTPAFNPEAANFQKVADPALGGAPGGGAGAAPAAAAVAAAPALSSSLAKPAMLTKSNTVTVTSNVAGRIFAEKAK